MGAFHYRTSDKVGVNASFQLLGYRPIAHCPMKTDRRAAINGLTHTVLFASAGLQLFATIIGCNSNCFGSVLYSFQKDDELVVMLANNLIPCISLFLSAFYNQIGAVE